MKVILCYGDSNTWGYNPVTQERFSIHERWTGVLADQLGDEYRVIEEGLNGRTSVWDDPIEDFRNGKEYLLPCLYSHKPIDLVVLMLGTNDLKKRFSASAQDIANGISVLVEIIQLSGSGWDNRAPKILLIAPPVVGKLSGYAEMFEDAVEKSSKFDGYYRQVADLYGCEYLDANQVVRSGDLDGVHLEVDQHLKLGRAVAARVKTILQDKKT
jgi:lysophospholipase L1-like esterase